MYGEIEIYNEIGKRIKKRRKSLKITQEKLAEITNYSLSFIANIESNTYQSFSISALNNIAHALNTNMASLLPEKAETAEISPYIKCGYCTYYAEIPQELGKLLYSLNDNYHKNLKLTCPKCHKKIT